MPEKSGLKPRVQLASGCLVPEVAGGHWLAPRVVRWFLFGKGFHRRMLSQRSNHLSIGKRGCCAGDCASPVCRAHTTHLFVLVKISSEPGYGSASFTIISLLITPTLSTGEYLNRDVFKGYLDFFETLTVSGGMHLSMEDRCECFFWHTLSLRLCLYLDFNNPQRKLVNLSPGISFP